MRHMETFAGQKSSTLDTLLPLKGGSVSEINMFIIIFNNSFLINVIFVNGSKLFNFRNSVRSIPEIF